MEGKLANARNALQRATELARNSPNPELTLPVAVEHARIEVAAAEQDSKGHATLRAGIQGLRSVIAAAKRLGYYELECEARLALGEAELKTDAAQGRSLLAGLQEETHERGLELLSRKSQQRALVAQSGPTSH